MPFISQFAFAALLLSPVLASGPWKQPLYKPDAEKASQVRDAFRTAWKGYYDHAFRHDSLLPLNNSFYDDRNGWGVTAIDSLSTAIVMEEGETVSQILEFASTVDFTTTQEVNSEISLFESNIRYLGGLLAGYDLLTGPYKDLLTTNRDRKLVGRLLKQAQILGNSLSIAFSTPTGIPDGTIYLNPKPRINGSESNGPAGIGTLVLEWTRLSDLTGNKTYAQLAQKAEKYLTEPQGLPESFPGLVGNELGIKDGKFRSQFGSWGGGTDSYYEYLIKMYLYDPDEFGHYKDRWVAAAESSIKHLASHPTSRPDLTFLAAYNGTQIIPASGHLASFVGGNFILGGVLLGDAKYVDFGLALAESYYETYKGTASGIGPELFRWATDANRTVPAEYAESYKKAGFWTRLADYALRPETIESLYYAYRVTGYPKYQDMVWSAFTTIRDRCRAGSGFAILDDVTKPDGGTKENFMESFFLAETLKYAYLTFAGEGKVHFQGYGKTTFVFNTEAHPLRIRHG
ncbi:uncharacterized protein UV8b_05848 [Ustilaginoidea virens]|uniref:alpha-1,2-Mannosidase n=1 Tax=Ustilaginoidea virens TaxID=1159556 RepID=A0A063CA97_USTVR|nr:uncharacterized protein UV8b_05848 [Ustilaginoidea virens]QUC21605.1 hypothetical protein UV8b_05848 [Ustilaginoidea virens]GAO13574.1 hypothetical protein UVI_02015530 [Ustilaginoidea virens]